MSGVNNKFSFETDIEDALLNEDKFIKTVKMLCELKAFDCGLAVQIDADELKIIHRGWLDGRTDWLDAEYSDPAMETLNHFKSFAILLDEFSKGDFVKFWKRTLDECKTETAFNDYAVHQEYAPDLAKNLVSGGPIYIAWMIAHESVRHFEKYKVGPYAPSEVRITAALEHEITVAIAHGHHNQFTLYNLLDALFVREKYDDV